MSAATGLLIFGEAAALGALLYGFRHEKAVVAFEDRQIERCKACLQRLAERRELRRRRRLNAKALYTPLGRRTARSGGMEEERSA